MKKMARHEGVRPPTSPLRTALQAAALPAELSVLRTGCRGWIRTGDRELMRLVGTAGLPYPAYLASREGLEPSAFGFGDHCAANCATEIFLEWSVYEDLNLGALRPKRSALTGLSHTPQSS